MNKAAVSFLLRIMMGAMCVVGLNISAAPGQQFSECPVHFAIIGDRTGSHVPGIYEQIVSEVERLKPDFVMTVGDHIEGYTEDSIRIKSEWAGYDSLVAKLTMPLYRTPGNHDILSDIAEKIYRELVAAPYRSFDNRNLHFVILDVGRWESPGELPKEELDWLANDLQEHWEAAYTFVFFHKPFWLKTVAEGKPDTLHSLFVKYGVDAVFNGHYHEYFSGMYDGVLYTSVGSSGGDTDPVPTGLKFHFVWVTVDGNGIHIAPIKLGSVLPWEEVTVADRKAYVPLKLGGLKFDRQVSIGADLHALKTEIGVILNNSSSSFPVKDTIRWTVPSGWVVEPTAIPVEVPAGQKATFGFNVSCPGKLYPLPSADANFTYARDKIVSVSGTLQVAREADCRPVEGKVKIDGNLAEAFWQNPVADLFDPNLGEVKIEPVKFYFAYDKGNLYLAAECKDSKADSLSSRAQEHDGAVFTDDCVGYFIEPVYATDTFYQIYFNPVGTCYDVKYWLTKEGELDGKKEWNGTYEVKTAKGKDGWTFEARIPLNQFGATLEKGKKMHINFRRKQPRFSAAADWQTPIEYNAGTYGILNMK